MSESGQKFDSYKKIQFPSADIQQVIDKINALPDLATPKDSEAVKAARGAYEALADKKSQIPESVVKKLIDAEESIGSMKAQEEAGRVAAAIAKIPSDLSKADKGEIEASVAAYERMSPIAYQLITDNEFLKLYNAKMYFDKKAAASKKVKLTKVTARKGGKATAKWKKGKAVGGYQLYYKAKKTKVKKVSTNAVKKTVKSLKAKMKYSFKVRPFTYVSKPVVKNGKRSFGTVKIYGKWSNVKKIKAK